MKNQEKILAVTGLLVAWIVVMAAAAPASASAADELPTAEQVFDRYAEVTGGREAWDGIRNRVVHSSVEIAAQGLKLDMTIYAAKPNRMYTLLESDLTGKVEQGCDGDVVWGTSVMTGPQVKEGKERAQALRDAAFDRLIYWREVYGSGKCVGVEDVDGASCYKLEMTPKPVEGEESPKPHTLYFDRKSGLLIRMDMVSESPMGTIPVESRLSDYREVDGVKIAHKITMKTLGQERILTTEKIEHNVDLPADRFEPPADVKAILEKKEGA
jgi:outer membrane lipoprotein-sorting protein